MKGVVLARKGWHVLIAEAVLTLSAHTCLERPQSLLYLHHLFSPHVSVCCLPGYPLFLTRDLCICKDTPPPARRKPKGLGCTMNSSSFSSEPLRLSDGCSDAFALPKSGGVWCLFHSEEIN